MFTTLQWLVLALALLNGLPSPSSPQKNGIQIDPDGATLESDNGGAPSPDPAWLARGSAAFPEMRRFFQRRGGFSGDARKRVSHSFPGWRVLARGAGLQDLED